MISQQEKALRFQALHQREGAFIIPNPWDVGTARLLAGMGFAALATTSAGYAFSRGLPDGSVGRPEALAYAAAIAAATELPVNGDLENGFGEKPEIAAETVQFAAAAGLVGGSIEDASREGDRFIYDIDHAVERVRAAAEAAHALPFPFLLTARAENYLYGRPDLGDTIRRLQRYQEAGADVLYAPGLTTREEISTVVRAVHRPVNVLMGLPGAAFTLADLAELGVRRVSVGSALSRVALGAFLAAAREMRDQGTFTFAGDAAGLHNLNAAFGDGGPGS
ncbi:MAG: isocitrate lyase/phosphoenolpyruvate mutase family protein [Acidobacteriaceae bacterium]|jgi:2-methylisocitrate lyase-like PEP mutase family enzyme